MKYVFLFLFPSNNSILILTWVAQIELNLSFLWVFFCRNLTFLFRFFHNLLFHVLACVCYAKMYCCSCSIFFFLNIEVFLFQFLKSLKIINKEKEEKWIIYLKIYNIIIILFSAPLYTIYDILKFKNKNNNDIT